jgi:hypothetical protein
MPPNLLGAVAVIPSSQGAVFEWDPVYASGSWTNGQALGAKVALALPPELVGKIVVVQSCTCSMAAGAGSSLSLPILNEDYTDPGDKGAFALSDADVLKVVDVRTLTTTYQLGNASGPGFHKDPTPVLINAKSPHLWAQLVVYGSLTLAAAGKIRMRLGVALG